MNPNPHVVFAGGASAGHLYPGVAVAAHLRELMPRARITFAGTGAPLERHAVRAAGHEYVTLPSRPVPRSPLAAFRFVTDNLAGFCAARMLLNEQNVSLVVGLGGYASTSLVSASIRRGTPTVLLEQNAIPGRTTRRLAGSADLVCIAFDAVRPHLPVSAPLLMTGNPARPAFERLYRQQRAKGKRRDMFCPSAGGSSPPAPGASAVPPAAHAAAEASIDAEGNVVTIPMPPRRERRLVVIGGAGGARSLNEHMPRALAQLGSRLAGWRVVHQTGEGQLQATIRRYAGCQVDALTVAYIDELAPILFETDLVVCRASGMTLAELALAGVPALLVPYPRADDDHQLANARVMQSMGACRVIEETSLSVPLHQALAAELDPLLSNYELRRSLATRIHEQAHPDSAFQIAAATCEILSGQHLRVAA